MKAGNKLSVSVCLALLGFWCVVLGLAGEPEKEWDAERRQCHEGKHTPVNLHIHIGIF